MKGTFSNVMLSNTGLRLNTRITFYNNLSVLDPDPDPGSQSNAAPMRIGLRNTTTGTNLIFFFRNTSWQAQSRDPDGEKESKQSYKRIHLPVPHAGKLKAPDMWVYDTPALANLILNQ
jgi:hypothetical protein